MDELKSNILSAAERLRQAEKTARPCSPVRDLIGYADVDLAYEVQKINTEYKLSEGNRVLGCKIGLTSEAVQKQLGVDQPDFGMLWSHTQVEANGHLAYSELMQPKVEAEVAFILKEDLDTSNLKNEDIIHAIESACLSLEIVGSRIKDWNIKITDTIADNASASHWMISNHKVELKNVDLEKCKMELAKNGEVVSTGVGSNCLGSPITATRWLANALFAMGRPLRKGEIVLSGALGPMVSITPDSRYEVRIEGLGKLSLTVN